MPNPAQVARAQEVVAAAGNQFMGMSFKAIADALKSVAGPSFKDGEFVAHVGNIQLNRIGATNEAGDTVNNLIPVAAAGVWQDVSFQIAAPSDRFRVILGLKLTLATKTAGQEITGAQLVPDGAVQQLIARGLIRLDRSRGRMVTSRTYQFLAGAENSRFQQQALAAGVQAASVAIAQPRTPSEYDILPHGFGAGLWGCIDAINPKDRCNFTLTGLATQAVQGSGLGQNDLVVGVDALVFDAVMSGQ